MARDVVCGMEVSADSKHHTSYKGEDFYFCCESCLRKFKANPEQYFEKEAVPAQSTEEPAASYTCPMHPEIQECEPGDCPKCGMALEPSGVPPVSGKTEYTCPMHPEVVQDHPGSCPKCGMALEPRTVAPQETNPELVDMTRRFWIGLVLALPVFLLAMTADLLPSLLPAALSMRKVQWIEFALATPVVLWAGWPLLARGWKSLQTRNLNMFTLIGLGV
ncbi:MAG: YHS domain-containing protein, partial [Candidatus Eiseniibacteriota bacterium]